MSTPPPLKLVLSFLEDLSRHNEKAWFEEHRAAYESARETFETWVEELIDVFRERDGLGDLTPRRCMPRIHRDIRFSRDKSPYKTNFGALIAPAGWKATAHGYYVSLQPAGYSMIAGGLYEASPEQLDRFRTAIDTNPRPLKAVLAAPGFKKAFGGLAGERLKTAPKGYDRDHPDLALLQLKQIVVIRRFADADVLAPDFTKHVIAHCRAMRPFLDYLTDLHI